MYNHLSLSKLLLIKFLIHSFHQGTRKSQLEVEVYQKVTADVAEECRPQQVGHVTCLIHTFMSGFLELSGPFANDWYQSKYFLKLGET